MQQQTNTTRFLRNRDTTTGWARWILMGIFAAVIHIGPLAAAAWSSGGLDRIMGESTPTTSQVHTLPQPGETPVRAALSQSERNAPSAG